MPKQLFQKGHKINLGREPWNKGLSMSQETKDKISRSKKDNSKVTPSSFKKGCIPWNKGKTGVYSDETKEKMGKGNRGKKLSKDICEKMSQTRIERGTFKEENNPGWRGGTTSWRNKIYGSIEYKNWRKAVFERDNYTCVWCRDDSGGNLNADHIKPFAYFPDLRFDIDNGRTLCITCHRKTSTYGNRYKKYVSSKR